jgi:hypothetical protein
MLSGGEGRKVDVPLGSFTVSDMSHFSAVYPHGPIVSLPQVWKIFLKTTLPTVASHPDYEPCMYHATEYNVHLKRQPPLSKFASRFSDNEGGSLDDTNSPNYTGNTYNEDGGLNNADNADNEDSNLNHVSSTENEDGSHNNAGSNMWGEDESATGLEDEEDPSTPSEYIPLLGESHEGAISWAASRRGLGRGYTHNERV